MLRVLWFATKITVLVSAAIWIMNRPGQVTFQWLGYDVQADIGFVLLCGFIALLLLLAAYRLLLAIVSIPKKWRAQKLVKQDKKGRRALTLGLTAIAAGDEKVSTYQAHRARKLLPDDRGLTVFLEAQAARLKGDDEAAKNYFHALLENKDMAFLGLRGLMLEAIEHGDLNQASVLAQKALKMYPKQPWVLRLSYDLELKQGHWAQADKILTRLVRFKILPEEKALSDRTSILIQQSEELKLKGLDKKALSLLKRAHKINPAFIPAAARLAGYYFEKGKLRSAAHVIQEAWKHNPHKMLAPLWRLAAPKAALKNDAALLSWADRLVSMKPAHVESQMAAATQALDVNLWGAAQQYLERAERIEKSARLYRLWGDLERRKGDDFKAQQMLERAQREKADKVWVCKETGRVYKEWSPVAQPHGSFNTIIWGYADAHIARPKITTDRTELLISAQV